MSIEDCVINFLNNQHPKIDWEQRCSESVENIARKKIVHYLNDRVGNASSIFVFYQVDYDHRRFFDRLFGRNQIENDWIFKNDDANKISVISWTKKSPQFITINNYLAGAECVYLVFMCGTHYNGNCVIEINLGDSRIGKTVLPKE